MLHGSILPKMHVFATVAPPLVLAGQPIRSPDAVSDRVYSCLDFCALPAFLENCCFALVL